ncbi:MAG: hypothetical protein ISR61_09435 [Desulfobacteraceae bacterium]|nr:hypothetical protein [Desulfobacteraceae bacterium]
MLDARCRMQVEDPVFKRGYRMHDGGCRIQDTRCRMHDAGWRMQVEDPVFKRGYWMLDSGCLMFET